MTGTGTLLIDAIVRQTTVLLATLATATGNRASLAHVANHVFLNLVGELKAQGVGNKVIADMFGMALRTYHERIARLGESRSDQGKSLWEAVLAFLQERGAALRADVLHRFGQDEEPMVRGVLRDLVDSGLVFRSGQGDRTTYRAATNEEQRLADGIADGDGTANMVLVAVHRHGPIERDRILDIVPMEAAALDVLLAALIERGDVTVEEREGVRRYRHDRVFIAFGDPAGWQAAVFDHYQAMVSAICAKLASGLTQAQPSDAVGGSTYTFDVWDGHPLEEDAVGLLRSIRRQAIALCDAVEQHNAGATRPPGVSAMRVIAYVGQNVLEDRGGDDE
jgi:hypothetical protein